MTSQTAGENDKSTVLGVVVFAILGLVILAVAGYGYYGVERRGDPIEPTGPPVVSVEQIHMGAQVEVEKDGRWYLGMIQKVGPGDAALIHYDGWDSKYDEVVPLSRLRLRTADN